MSFLFEELFFGHEAEKLGLRETERAEDKAIAANILGSCFSHQRNLIEDRCRRKAALCPRRAGKSHCAMSYAFWTCLMRVGARVVIVTLSLKHARNVYWFDMMAYADKFGIKGKFYQNELRFIGANDSQILLIGADSRAEIEKLRGGKYDLVILDECKSFAPVVLNELIDEVIWPALADRKGTMMMIGTPGNILSGKFFETTYPGFAVDKKRKCSCGKASCVKRPVSRDFYTPEGYWTEHAGDRLYWSRHHWTVEDNKAVEGLWHEMLEMKELNEWSDDEPIWRREALGEWVATPGAFVYAYASIVSTLEADRAHWKPDYKEGNEHGLAKGVEWRYLLGIDFGYEDDFALVVVAYNPHDGVLYHVWDFHENHLIVDDMVREIERAFERFGQFDAVVADSGALNTLLIETINKRHGRNIVKADKREKFDHIELLNSDMRSGRIKLIPKSDLAIQMASLQFDLSKGAKEELARMGKLQEMRTMPNDLCDAFLYIWRYSFHYYTEHRRSFHEVGTREWQREVETAVMDRMVAARRETTKLGDLGRYVKSMKDPLSDYYVN